MPNVEAFRSRFKYNPGRTLWCGIEREQFIVDTNGQIVPRATDVMRLAEAGLCRLPWADTSFATFVPAELQGGKLSYELSACQIESKTSPAPLSAVMKQLRILGKNLEQILDSLGLKSHHYEVGPSDMPLDVYPDPTGRYQQIVQAMTREELLAACRIIGTHVHIGMPDHETALRVYNEARRHTERLCRLGDKSEGKRLAIYRKVTPDTDPPWYESWAHFYECACRLNFSQDPRRCWTLIRISVHGTIEFRMFGTTSSEDEIGMWASECHDICQAAMAMA